MTTTIGIEAAELVEFTPSEEWIEDFTKQCTDEMRVKVKRYATRRLRGVGKAGAYVDDDTAKELVQNVLGDTVMGIVAWDPARKTLQQHAEDTIQFRTRNERKRANKYKHQRIDAFDPAAERHGARAELEASIQSDRDDNNMESVIFASEVIDQLRELAFNDRPALCFLDAVVAGARSRADIMDFTKMSLKNYRNVRGRLRRLVEQLDNQTGIALRA